MNGELKAPLLTEALNMGSIVISAAFSLGGERKQSGSPYKADSLFKVVKDI